MRPRRKVERTPRGYEVTANGTTEFITTVEALAHEVARKYDRIDPLPCEHNGEWIDVGGFTEPPGTVFIRQCCSESWHRGEERD